MHGLQLPLEKPLPMTEPTVVAASDRARRTAASRSASAARTASGNAISAVDSAVSSSSTLESIASKVIWAMTVFVAGTLSSGPAMHARTRSAAPANGEASSLTMAMVAAPCARASCT